MARKPRTWAPRTGKKRKSFTCQLSSETLRKITVRARYSNRSLSGVAGDLIERGIEAEESEAEAQTAEAS